jgi:enoyl-CoA hydratase
MPSPYDTLAIEAPRDGVLLLKLNRPDRLNAMNGQLVEDLHRALDEIGRDSGCRVVVLTGAGRGFCAGSDLNGYGDVPDVDSSAGQVQRDLAMQEHISSLMPAFRNLPQPVIAAVNGPAVGGGLAFVCAADIRLAAVSASFGIGFVRIGLSGCDVSVSWTLPKLVGIGRAQELMLTGRVFGSAEALDYGLVVEVVEDADLLDRALLIGDQIISNSPAGITLTKRVMWSALEISGQRAAMTLENQTQVILLQTADHAEGRRAFLERRSARYKNR